MPTTINMLTNPIHSRRRRCKSTTILRPRGNAAVTGQTSSHVCNNSDLARLLISVLSNHVERMADMTAEFGKQNVTPIGVTETVELRTRHESNRKWFSCPLPAECSAANPAGFG